MTTHKGNVTGPYWTPYMDKRLRALKDEGYSYVEIRHLMGLPSDDSAGERLKLLNGGMTRFQRPWTKEEDELLTKLCAEQDTLSYRQIGVSFPDRSKNSLIGRAQRLGIVKKQRAQVVTIKRKPVEKFAKPRMDKPIPGRITPMVITANVAPPDSRALSELGHNACRWSYDDFSFCGKERKRGAYCAEHGDLVYVAIKPITYKGRR